MVEGMGHVYGRHECDGATTGHLQAVIQVQCGVV